MVELLINRGAGVDITKRDQETALWSAAGKRGFQAVQILLDHGTNPLHKDRTGQTVLERSVPSPFGIRGLKAILKAMEERGIQYDLTGLIHKVEENLRPEKGDKRLKYLVQHWCRMKYPCR